MDYRSMVVFVWWAILTAGVILALSGLVRLAVRNKAGPWKDGGASLLSGVIVTGVLVALMLWLGWPLMGPPS